MKKSSLSPSAIRALVLVIASTVTSHDCGAQSSEESSTATEFVFKVTGNRFTLSEERTGRVVAEDQVALSKQELTKNNLGSLALDYTQHCMKIGRIASDSGFVIKNDSIGKNGDYTATILRFRTSARRRMLRE
jgi:hypothetical protein